MSDKPSYTSSTLSQAFWVTTLTYLGMMLLLVTGLIWFKLPLEIAEKPVGWMTTLWGMVSSAYLTGRKVNGESKPKEPDNAPVVPAP